MHELAKEVQPIKNLLPGIEQELLIRSETPEFPLATLPRLSKKIHGLKRGLTIVGARTSQGKTAFTLQIATDLADQNIPVLYLSLEMTKETLIERMFSELLEVDNYALLTGEFKKNAEIQAKWRTFAKQMAETPLLITEGLGRNFQHVIELLERLDPKPRVIFLDYLQMIKNNNKQEREMIDEYIRAFRTLCLQNKICGVICSQVNRGVFSEKMGVPSLEHLKGSGGIEEVADFIFLLNWNYFYTHKDEDKNKFELYVAKNRNGRTGKFDLFYLPEYYKFEEGKLYGQEESKF